MAADSLSLSGAVARSWRAPRAVVAALLAQDRREGRLMMYLMLALGIVFVAQLPRLSRLATPEIGFEPLMAGALFGILFLGPLLAYALAGALTLVLRLAAPVEPFAVRLALFWALLASAPLVLAQAALVAVAGPGLAAAASGWLVLAACVLILGAGLRVALAQARGAAMLTPARLAALVRLTLADPEQGGRAVLALNPPLPARWLAMFAAVLVGVVLAYAPLALTGDLSGVPTPLTTAGLQIAANLFAVGAMTGIGRMLGGRGRIEDALLLVARLQALMVLVQLAQLAMMMVVPGLAGLLMILAVALFFWLMTGLVQALHGFAARFPVLLGVIATMFVAAMLVTFLLLLLGFDPRAMTDV